VVSNPVISGTSGASIGSTLSVTTNAVWNPATTPTGNMWLFMASGGTPATAGEGTDSNGYTWTRQMASTTFTIGATASSTRNGTTTNVSTVGGYWKVRQAPLNSGADAFSSYIGPTP
jgi:hypothetical protein